MNDTLAQNLFGTDGIRGRANVPPLDPETLVQLGRVLGAMVREHALRGRGVLFAHDGRISAEMIRCSLTAGLLAAGVDSYDAGLATTPALAHETRLGGFAAGVMISASHNPADDNGIKIFGANGRKIPDDVEQHIARSMALPATDRSGRRAGRASRLELGASAYRRFLSTAFSDLDLSATKILVDCANGGGSRLVPAVLEGLGATVVTRNDAPDGTNINDNCGALHPNTIAPDVVAEGCALGLCLDGDGDRAIFIDEGGKVVHGDALLALLAVGMKSEGTLARDTVVVTVMSNLGLKRAVASHGIRVVETPVGDRSVMAAMLAEDLCLGGENSGHVIFGERHYYTGDGLYTCLELLALIARSGLPLSRLASCFTAYPQLLVNVPVREKPELTGLPLVNEAVHRSEQELAGNGRVVLRYSGTENLCRVMVEAPATDVVERLVAQIVDAVKQSVGT